MSTSGDFKSLTTTLRVTFHRSWTNDACCKAFYGVIFVLLFNGIPSVFEITYPVHPLTILNIFRTYSMLISYTAGGAGCDYVIFKIPSVAIFKIYKYRSFK